MTTETANIAPESPSTAPITPMPAEMQQAVAESPIVVPQEAQQQTPAAPQSIAEAMGREGDYLGEIMAKRAIGSFARQVKATLGTGAEHSA